MKKKPIFNSKEKLILHTVGRHRKMLTINEVSTETGISWITCKKYLEKFYDDGLLQKEIETTKGKRIISRTPRYQIDFEKIYKD